MSVVWRAFVLNFCLRYDTTSMDMKKSNDDVTVSCLVSSNTQHAGECCFLLIYMKDWRLHQTHQFLALTLWRRNYFF